MQFAKRMRRLQTSVFTQLDKAKLKAIEEGKKVYDFTIGSPNIAPSKEIINSLIEEASKPKSYMYALHDIKELRDTVKKWYKERYEVELDSESEILSLQGSQEGLTHITLALCDEGDIVLIPSPSYPAFANGAYIAGAQVYEMPMLKENDYLIQFDQIPESIARKAKMMIVSYPNNPTGANAPDDFFDKLIAFAKAYDIIVVYDNAYSNLVFDGKPGRSFLYYKGAKDVGIEFNSFSKSYGMAGARIGLCVGNKEIVGALRLLKSNIDYGMFLPIQKAAITALTQNQNVVVETCRQYQKRRDIIVKALCDMGWHVDSPQGTMFMWAQIPEGFGSSEEFALQLFEHTGILVTPGSAFGKYGEGFVRIALVQDESLIIEALEVLKESGFLA